MVSYIITLKYGFHRPNLEPCKVDFHAVPAVYSVAIPSEVSGSFWNLPTSIYHTHPLGSSWAASRSESNPMNANTNNIHRTVEVYPLLASLRRFRYIHTYSMHVLHAKNEIYTQSYYKTYVFILIYIYICIYTYIHTYIHYSSSPSFLPIYQVQICGQKSRVGDHLVAAVSGTYTRIHT